MDQSLEQVEKIGIDAFVYAVYAALIPLNMILNFTGSTINRYVGIVAAAFIGMSVLMKKKKGIKKSKPISSLIIFAIWCTLSVFWSLHQRTSMGQYITFISSVALCLICVIRDFNARELRLIKFFMVIPSAILVFYLNPNKDISWSRGTLSNSTGHADQNSLAANLVFAFWVAIDLYQTAEKKSSRFLYATCAILIVVGLLFIASRGAILALAISGLMYIALFKKEKIRFTTIIIIAFAVVSIGFIVVALDITSFERLSFASILDDSGTGRFALWEDLLAYMSRDDVLRAFGGYGFGTEMFVSRLASGLYMGIHNTYLEYFFTTGIIGLFLLLAFFVTVFKHSIKNKDSIGTTLLVVLVIVCIPLGFLLNKGTWNVLMLVMTGISQARKKDEKNDLEGGK